MKIIAVVAQKGGTGKSTVTANMAVAARLAGRATLVADCDPQGSLVDWGRARGNAAPQVTPVRVRALDPLRHAVERVGVQQIVIDTRSSSEEDSVTAARLADLTLIVVRPTAADLRAVARTVETLKALRRPTAFVINQAPSRRVGLEPVIVTDAVALLVGYALPVAPVALRSRLVYQSSFAGGLGVQELDPWGQAAAETAALWAYVEGRLGPL